ncbi:outer membrane protein assembly factor [Flavobacterium agricola]|uniref:Outer membrane protein assembly factor n=1 Tax=Flavobacterium agricola TaxID=2870839 RepID=A0ABY6LVX8_9FLAO|nr:outer membrane protein assembly factor [Flavobacterium agricola]UYW00485.1 outer membrane protein assembly factor [Flavobacterium agricola]
MKLKLKLLVLIQIFTAFTAFSQVNTEPENTVVDSVPKAGFFGRIVNYFEEAKKDKSEKKFDISFIGGPSYSVDTQFGIGMVASGLYRIDKEDLSLSPSNVAIYTNITTSGFFSIGVENTTIFPKDKYRIYYDMNFAFRPSEYFGIGYEAGLADVSSDYNDYRLGLDANFLKKFWSNVYAGAVVSAQNYRAKDFKNLAIAPDQNYNTTAVGGGYVFSYDSRDFIPNPYKGVYVSLQQTFYTKALGSSYNFNQIDFTARTYKQVWKGGILAFDLNGNFANGDVPWNMLPQLGGSRQMRGYFKGQYRDKKQVNTQIELRQKIYNRHGVVLWGGAGNVFHSFDTYQWKQTLPNYGIGYRWEFKNRVNIRFDYGIGKNQSGFYFNINESF